MNRASRAIRRGFGASVGLWALLATSAVGDQQTPGAEGTPLLADGKWGGFYKPHASGRNDATFLVKRDKDGDWNIKMKLDLQPSEEFDFVLDEIELGDDTLSFVFGKEGSTRECKLEKKANASLRGVCFYRSASNQAVRAIIEMRPPLPPVGAGAGEAAEEGEPAAEPTEAAEPEG